MKTTRLLILPAVLAGAALAGCGGSSHRPSTTSTTTVAQVQTTAPSPTDSTASSTHTGAAHKHATATSSTTTATTSSSTVSVPHRVITRIRYNTPAQDAGPLRCLRIVGLRGAEAFGNLEWRAVAPAGQPVLVDGSNRTAHDAKLSAQSLLATGYAVTGGTYVVSTTLRYHDPAVLNAVARCLAFASASPPRSRSAARQSGGGKKGKGSLSF